MWGQNTGYGASSCGVCFAAKAKPDDAQLYARYGAIAA
jgi:hypothetical protein